MIFIFVHLTVIQGLSYIPIPYVYDFTRVGCCVYFAVPRASKTEGAYRKLLEIKGKHLNNFKKRIRRILNKYLIKY